MSPDSRSRGRMCGLLLVALVVGRAAHSAPPDPTVDPILRPELPGQEAVEGLRRALSIPSPTTRWRNLPRFGRELFAGAEARFPAIEDGPVGPDYVLGPGDNLVVYVSGLTDTSFALTLDREGKVFVPRVGTTFLWGLSFAEAEALIRSRIATMLRNARVMVSMGRLRSLEVLVLGAVERPGKVTVTGFATAFHALYAAGGPDSLGSLRDIRILRARREIARLDLYRFLMSGDRSDDPRLQSGDVLFVPFALGQVGIQGAVTRPGVYESNGPLSLSALFEMAGGPSPFADLARVRVERVDAHGGFRLQDLPLANGQGIDPDSLMLSDYDLVTVLPLHERQRNVVTLDGFVRHPGEYELTSGLTLARLLAPERLLPEAELERAELRRVDPHTFQVEVRPFSVRAAWGGDGDIELRPLDAVTVFSSARFPRTVSLEGQVMRPGDYTTSPGERLSDVLRRAGGLTPDGHLPGAVFLRRSAARRERAHLQEFVERQRLELAQQRAQLAQAGDSAGASELERAQANLMAAVAHQSDPGRVVLNLDPRGRWVGTDQDPVLEDGDRLIVPLQPTTVAVIGSVMNPGTLMARRSASFDVYLRLAGGPTRQADLGQSYVLKANGEALSRRSASRIEPGDAIVVPPREIGRDGIVRSLSGGLRFAMELATVAAVVIAATR